MKKKVLQTLFYGKISMELNKFKRQILELELEEIWACAYEIDTKISIYELLVEMIPVMLEEQLQGLISFPDVLDYLYEMWMRTEDSHMEELKICLVRSLAGRASAYENIEEKEGAVI